MRSKNDVSFYRQKQIHFCLHRINFNIHTQTNTLYSIGMALSIEKYEYMDEDAIDDKLKCIICTQPFQYPVSLDCQHIFCQFCIETWNKNNASCPICRRQFRIFSELTKITDPSICDQLDCLLVRCLRCHKIGIKRNQFTKHFQRCSKNRMATLTDSIRHRWRSMRRTIQVKRNHQIRVTPAAEIIRTNHEPRSVNLQGDYQQFSNLHTRFVPQRLSPRSARCHWLYPIRTRDLEEASERRRRSVFKICIFIATIVCLVIFKQGIL
jgi:hypothetical protein